MSGARGHGCKAESIRLPTTRPVMPPGPSDLGGSTSLPTPHERCSHVILQVTQDERERPLAGTGDSEVDRLVPALPEFPSSWRRHKVVACPVGHE